MTHRWWSLEVSSWSLVRIENCLRGSQLSKQTSMVFYTQILSLSLSLSLFLSDHNRYWKCLIQFLFFILVLSNIICLLLIITFHFAKEDIIVFSTFSTLILWHKLSMSCDDAFCFWKDINTYVHAHDWFAMMHFI